MTLHVYYSPDYVAAEYSFDTTRKAAWVADAVRDLAGVSITPPSPAWDDAAVEAAIRLVHDDDYVDALATGQPRDLAQSQGFIWDEGLWRAVRASTAGVLSAVDVVLGAEILGPTPARPGDRAIDLAATGTRLAGSLSSGMHHAKYATGDGFCSVNALVVASAYAVARYDVDVTVLDVDAHAGGGTDQLLRLHDAALGLTRVRHLDLTTKPYDSYSALSSRSADINIEDVGLNGDDDAYLAAIDRLLSELPSGPRHLVLHNAGMDPSPEITFSALAERERRVTAALDARGLAGVFVLAGGYTSSASRDEIAAAHASTAEAFAAITSQTDSR